MNNKEIATQFLELIVAGRIEEAYQKYVEDSGKHHNAFFVAGFTALKKGMVENHAQFPYKQLVIKHVLGDGDMVVTHSHLTFSEGEAGMVVVHLFRIKEGKIVEMWDCGQPIPPDSPNTDGVF